MGVINNLLGRLKLYADPSVTTQTTTVVQSNTTNSNLALVPNGTGAIVASIPDGTATGGNARGTYAVDLQLARTSATQVASGQYSTISGGYQNSAGNYCTVSGGQNNNATGNVYATIVGGQNNVASGPNCVTGGYANSATGGWTTAFGYNNNPSFGYAFCLGKDNIASGRASGAFGEAATSTASNSFGFGTSSTAYLTGQIALAYGNFGTANGEAQQSLLTARKSAALATGATTVLSLDNTGTTNLIIPTGTNRAWNVQINTIAIIVTITGTATGVSVGDTYSEVKNLLFKKVSGTSSIVGTVDTSNVKSDTSMSTCALTVTAGASQEMALTFTAPTFTGGGTVTCRVVSKVMLTEVAY